MKPSGFAGVLAAAAKLRPKIIQPSKVELGLANAPANTNPEGSFARSHHIEWAKLLARVGIDALACPQCGGRMRLIAAITDPAVVHRILEHAGLPTDPPSLSKSRAPP